MNAKPAVMHLVDTLEAGGAERMCVQLANALAGAGYRVHVCATRRGGRLEAAIGAGVEKMVLGRRGRWDVGAVARLRQYVRREGIRVLHAHGTAVFVAAAARTGLGEVRLVWHVHYGRLLDEREWVWVYRLMRGWVDGVVSVNEALAEWAVRRAGFRRDRVWVGPNFASVAAGTEAAELPGVAGFRIVQVANVRPQKDHATMLEAMARIVKEEPRARLLVVGACEDDHGVRVRQMAKQAGLEGRVHFLGVRDDVGAIVRGCDVGVLSSASEGLPVALLEYGEAGLAVACTDVGDCRKVVEGAGRLVAAGDAAGLAEAVIEYLRNPELRAEMGRRLQERVRARWSREAAVRVMEEVYETVIGERGACG